LNDRVYITPRFPDGIKRDQLRWRPPAIQIQTILSWFTRNYEQPRGPYFGLAVAIGTEPKVSGIDDPVAGVTGTFDGTLEFDSNAQFITVQDDAQVRTVSLLGEAPLCDGGTSDTFLAAELAEALDEGILVYMAKALPGQWVPMTDSMSILSGAESEDLRTGSVRLLDELDHDLRSVPERNVDRWDNGPPEKLPDDSPIVALEEREIVLRATADMRIALSSKDFSRANERWDIASAVLAKVTGALVEEIAEDFKKKLASAMFLMLSVATLWTFGIVTKIRRNNRHVENAEAWLIFSAVRSRPCRV